MQIKFDWKGWSPAGFEGLEEMVWGTAENEAVPEGI